MRLVSPDRGCIEADVGNARYRGRIMEVSNPAHAAALKAVGYFEASLGGVDRSKGHQCANCGRYNYLPTCGRCAAAHPRP